MGEVNRVKKAAFGILCALLLTVAALLPAQVAANMVLSNVIVHFEPDTPSRQDVEISNAGEDTLYIEIQPDVVSEPGTDNEARSRIRDPRESGLLVTPNKMVLPPGATKVIRLVKVGQVDRERIYRIAARPISSGVEATQTGLKIMVGYEILAIVYPNRPKPALVVERNGRNLMVRNDGNTNVLLREGYQCAEPRMPHEECTRLPGRRIYPGNQWITELPEDLPITYYQSVGTKNYIEEYP